MSKAKSSVAKSEPPHSSTIDPQTPVTPEQRYQMIAEAAYYRAEKRGFDGVDVWRDWCEAEAEIDRFLQ